MCVYMPLYILARMCGSVKPLQVLLFLTAHTQHSADQLHEEFPDEAVEASKPAPAGSTQNTELC